MLRAGEEKERKARPLRKAVGGNPGGAFRDVASFVEETAETMREALDFRHPDAEEPELEDHVGDTRALALCEAGRGTSVRDIRVVATAQVRHARHEARHMSGEATRPRVVDSSSPLFPRAGTKTLRCAQENRRFHARRKET